MLHILEIFEECVSQIQFMVSRLYGAKPVFRKIYLVHPRMLFLKFP